MTQQELPLTVGKITQLETWTPPKQEERKPPDEVIKKVVGRAIKGTLEPLAQRDKIFGHLLSGYTLTPIQALEWYGCFRLSARIKDLRNDGVNIKTEIVSENGKKFARYSLIKGENK